MVVIVVCINVVDTNQRLMYNKFLSRKELNMPFIENCAADDIPKAFHHDPGPNSMLIQISDPGSWKPIPKHQFKEIWTFEFLDVEKNDHVDDDAMRCSQQQADDLVNLLAYALENKMNVIVHCYAGICRSGAVCEVGVMMGFTSTGRYRQPNLLVKHRMMKTLGLTYDDSEESSPVNLSAKYGWEREGDI